MDCNGLLWIFRNPVNGFEDTSMDCYGVFSGRRPDTKVYRSIASPQMPINTGFYEKEKPKKVAYYNFTTTFFGAMVNNREQ